MRAPFAAWLCQQASPPTPAEGHFSWDSMRRYVVAPVTRPGKGRGLPAVFMQVGMRLDCPLPSLSFAWHWLALLTWPRLPLRRIWTSSHLRL